MFCNFNFSILINSGVTEYWYFDFENATTIYCDEEPKCEVTFDADSDIDGYGVAAAFILVAWLTIAITSLNAWYPMGHVIQRFRAWNPREPTLNALYTNIATERPLHHMERFTDHALLTLCDVQLAAAFAILVAGMTQWKSIDFYHSALVASYFDLTLNSFFAARLSQGRTIRDASGEVGRLELHLSHIRNFVIVIVMAMSCVSETKTSWDGIYRWNPWEKGLCYKYHYAEPTWVAWFWLSMKITNTISVAVQVFVHVFWGYNRVLEWSEKVAENQRHRWVRSVEHAYEIWDTKLPQSVLPGSGQTGKTLRLCGRILKLSVLTVILTAVLGIIFLWGMMPPMDGFQGVEILTYILFAAMSTYYVIDLEYSNRSLLVRSGNIWGFGQIIALVALFALVIGFFKDEITSIQEEEKAEKSNDKTK